MIFFAENVLSLIDFYNTTIQKFNFVTFRSCWRNYHRGYFDTVKNCIIILHKTFLRVLLALKTMSFLILTFNFFYKSTAPLRYCIRRVFYFFNCFFVRFMFKSFLFKSVFYYFSVFWWIAELNFWQGYGLKTIVKLLTVSINFQVLHYLELTCTTLNRRRGL